MNKIDFQKTLLCLLGFKQLFNVTLKKYYYRSDNGVIIYCFSDSFSVEISSGINSRTVFHNLEYSELNLKCIKDFI